jgi:hypothetical protein
MMRMNAHQELHFSWHALPLSKLRGFCQTQIRQEPDRHPTCFRQSLDCHPIRVWFLSDLCLMFIRLLSGPCTREQRIHAGCAPGNSSVWSRIRRPWGWPSAKTFWLLADWLLASSEARSEPCCACCCWASRAMLGCFCPLAPDWRTAIDCPGNGPRSIAPASLAHIGGNVLNVFDAAQEANPAA